MTKGGAAYFGGAGLEVVFAQSAELPNNPRDVHPGTLFEWARANVPASADVVFVGGNGFRAIGMIEALVRKRLAPCSGSPPAIHPDGPYFTPRSRAAARYLASLVLANSHLTLG